MVTGERYWINQYHVALKFGLWYQEILKEKQKNNNNLGATRRDLQTLHTDYTF